MYNDVSENQTSVNCFAKTNSVWTLWAKTYDRNGRNGRHCRNGRKLKYLVSRTITPSENVLESLSNGSGIGTRCLKPETIEKSKDINNFVIANEKWLVVAFDNDENVHMSVFTSKVHYNAKLLQ